MDAQAEGSIELTAKDHPIKAIDTEYAYFCFSYADLVNAGLPNNTALHTIGFEAIIDPRSAKHIHHFVLAGSQDDLEETSCEDMLFIEIAFAWAPGELPLLAPPNVGGPLGVNGFKSFQLEIHYNNPWLDSGTLDSSGVRIYYTSELRPQEFGMLQLGDPFVSLYGQPVGDGFVQHTFDCPASCSSLALKEPITVVREWLHMHRTGQSMLNYQIRDDSILRVGQSQYYVFDQQGGYAVPQEPFQIEPGDSFRTTCQYKSNGTLFGISSQEEMCMVFILYYPRQQISALGMELPYMCGRELPISACNSSWEKVDLQGESDLNRTFGIPADSCPTYTEASGAAFFSLWTASIFTLVLASTLLDW
jgi:hypothetical protein